ncbi:MAG: hypothetical protein AAGJ87_14970 [Pseudomonadota bacterium]
MRFILELEKRAGLRLTAFRPNTAQRAYALGSRRRRIVGGKARAAAIIGGDGEPPSGRDIRSHGEIDRHSRDGDAGVASETAVAPVNAPLMRVMRRRRCRFVGAVLGGAVFGGAVFGDAVAFVSVTAALPPCDRVMRHLVRTGGRGGMVVGGMVVGGMVVGRSKTVIAGARAGKDARRGERQCKDHKKRANHVGNSKTAR